MIMLIIRQLVNVVMVNDDGNEGISARLSASNDDSIIDMMIYFKDGYVMNDVYEIFKNNQITFKALLETNSVGEIGILKHDTVLTKFFL